MILADTCRREDNLKGRKEGEITARRKGGSCETRRGIIRVSARGEEREEVQRRGVEGLSIKLCTAPGSCEGIKVVL